MEYPIKGPSWKFVSSYAVKIKQYSLLKCFRLNGHRHLLLKMLNVEVFLRYVFDMNVPYVNNASKTNIEYSFAGYYKASF